jgi:anti-sigma B factor antagonist
MNIVSPTKTKVEQSGDLAIMRFEGDITSVSEEAVLGKYNALDAGARKILLDFSKVPYLNSSGIALVIQLLMAAKNASRTVVCFGLSAHFQKVFTMLGLAKYTTLQPDEAAARSAVA